MGFLLDNSTTDVLGRSASGVKLETAIAGRVSTVGRNSRRSVDGSDIGSGGCTMRVKSRIGSRFCTSVGELGTRNGLNCVLGPGGFSSGLILSNVG